MNKVSNEEKYKNYQKRKVLRWLIILCALLTIVFVLVYYATMNYAYVFVALVFFIINVILNKMRENTPSSVTEEKKDKNENKKKSNNTKKKTK